MQVFRLMGMPDKVIAFDSLPERFLKGFEMIRADGFPRHWKEWMGKKELITKIPPEKDQMTGAVRTFPPIVESDSFFYLVDWNLSPVVERWKEVCAFVKQSVPSDFRLKEYIDDMALPLAANKTDGVTLEPEDVVVIPILLELQEKLGVSGAEVKKKELPITIEKCPEEGCTSEFEGQYAKQALRMHTQKKHKVVAAA